MKKLRIIIFVTLVVAIGGVYYFLFEGISYVWTSKHEYAKGERVDFNTYFSSTRTCDCAWPRIQLYKEDDGWKRVYFHPPRCEGGKVQETVGLSSCLKTCSLQFQNLFQSRQIGWDQIGYYLPENKQCDPKTYKQERVAPEGMYKILFSDNAEAEFEVK